MADKDNKQEDDSKALLEKRLKDIDGKKITDEEKEILRLHDKGLSQFEIAQKVYKFVNNDTVGSVVLAIRREHAEDYSEIENINSTKGYTGV